MVAVNFICDIRPTTHLDPGYLENFLQLTGSPKPNPEVFKKRHDYRALNFIHRVDTRILGSRDTVTDKVELLESYAALLKFYGHAFVEKFKMKIYLSIRMLFSRFKTMPELRKKAFFDAACGIAKEFVSGVKTAWLQAELPGFCSLIVPFVTLTHLGVAPKVRSFELFLVVF